MKNRKSGAVSIFIGLLLVAVFIIGLIVRKNPEALVRPYRDDLFIEHLTSFCAGWWLPAGIIGIPLLLISLIICLVRENREKSE